MLLDPLRTTPPLPFQCSRQRCRTTIAYWALTSHGARIAPGPRRRASRDGIAGTHADVEGRTVLVGGAADLMFPDFDHEGRFEVAVEWALDDRQGQINLVSSSTLASPWQRRSFTCNANYTRP
ncbi:MAG: hypothetical protein P1T08_06570 [Acidimicrobiia bacterium]|nr:hypothetical protein [Acidimicrobiia bacterium]